MFTLSPRYESVWAYDLESYPNAFTFCLTDGTRKVRVPLGDTRKVLSELSKGRCTMVGFNNLGYDEHLLEYIIANPGCTEWDLYNLTETIIKEGRWPLNDRQRHIRQLDLYKIHHFDNDAKRTSLKMLEFNMRMGSIEDLPFAPGTYLTDEQIEQLWDYNEHDVDATWAFYQQPDTQDLINFRRGLGQRWWNYSNTKLGAEWMVRELEKRGLDVPRHGTFRDRIALGNLLLPYIWFNDPSFNKVLDFFRNAVITETKGVFTNLSAKIDGFSYDFGTGGIHGSRRGVFKESGTHVIYDWDVASFYPNLAIVNRFYPAHLGDEFCTVYEEIYEERKKHAKGTPLNKALKEALNATYGNSNNQYSPFYDPAFTMSITINGQLLLCMLSQALLAIDCYMIQINTDGLTVKCPVDRVGDMKRVCSEWEELTGLVLESAEYSAMHVRDVNNYIAIGTDGKVKLKGAYAYARGWHQNHSALVVPKAVEANVLHRTPIADFIRGHDDPFDFMLRTKVRRSDRLYWGDEEQQRICRYYMSTNGKALTKVMPPVMRDYSLYTGGDFDKLGKINHERDGDMLLVWQKAGRERAERHGFIWVRNERRPGPDRVSSVESGYLVTIANKMVDKPEHVNYDYYIDQANKLLEGFKNEI